MRQKYVISKNDDRNELKIREYAILDKEQNKARRRVTTPQDFALIGQEKYDRKVVLKTISRGRLAVMALLRTKNLFPIEPYAQEIAKTVMTLYGSPRNDTVELLFDDVELLTDLHQE